MKKNYKLLVIFLVIIIIFILSLSACNLFGKKDKEITINYQTNGGTAISSVKVLESQIAVPALIDKASFRTGYELDYWYVIVDGREEKDIAAYFASNIGKLPDQITIGIKWKKITYIVSIYQNLDMPEAKYTLKKNGVSQTIEGNEVNSAFEYGTKLELTASEDSLEDFTWLGWSIDYQDPNSDSSTYVIESLKEDINIEAKWDAKYKCLVAFYDNVVEPDTSYDINMGVGLSETIKPRRTKPGSVFKGWSKEKEPSSDEDFISDSRGKFKGFPTKEMAADGAPKVSIYAIWENNINITYNHDADTNTYSVTGINPKFSGSRLYIPSTLFGGKVTSIDANAFKDISDTNHEVVIPYTISSIHNTAFTSYKGNLFFDVASNIKSLINLTSFTVAHNIYVHAFHVKSVHEGATDFSNVFEIGVNSSLIDGIFANYFNRIVTSFVKNEDELHVWSKYSTEFTLINDVALKSVGVDNGSALITKMDNKYANYRSIANDTVNKGYNRFSKTDSIKLVKKEMKIANKRLGAESTDLVKRQDQAIDLLYKPLNNEDERHLSIEFAPELPVFNSEQAVYAYANNMKPIFIMEDDGAPYQYSESAKVASNKLIETVKKITNDGMDDFEKVEAIHDWISFNNTYDSALLEIYMNNPNNPDINHYAGFYLEGTMNNNISVCDGIAKTFLAMTRAAGIESIKAEGISHSGGGGTGVAHAWNKVKIDNIWYAIDVTGNDPTVGDNDRKVNGGRAFEIMSHSYYLVPDGPGTHFTNKNTEAVDKNGEPLYNYPQATGNYNYYLKKKYDGTKSISVGNKLELLAYCNHLKTNSVREPGKLYSFEIASRGGYRIETNSIATVFGAEYKANVGELNDKIVVLLKR